MERIVCVGGSAGGMEAALDFASHLQGDRSVALLIVLHLGEGLYSSLLRRFEEAAGQPAEFASDGEKIRGGRTYIAPPGMHTLVEVDRFAQHAGPRVNHARPAIDLCLRSVAVNYSGYCAGVVLSGLLDDGKAGLSAVQRCGGLTLVQDPAQALFPDMPSNALEIGNVDHVLPSDQLATVLRDWLRRPVARVDVPKELELEYRFDLNIGRSDMPGSVEEFGHQLGMGCPDCGGPLWETGTEKEAHYRCHIGHGYTAQVLIDQQESEVEHALWVALRTLEEKRRMQERLSHWKAEGGETRTSRIFAERVEETRSHIRRLRNVLAMLKAQQEADAKAG